MKEIEKKLYTSIVTGNLQEAQLAVEESIQLQVSPEYLIEECMSKAMNEVGRRFENNEAFVPELLMAGRAMKGALEKLKPYLGDSQKNSHGRIVIGTVKGDLHDIGKNLVASMLEGGGFEVLNLGVDISVERFVDTVKQEQPNILCLSALLTTTMLQMQEVIVALEEAGLRDQLKVMVGGAPVTAEFAEKIGADGFSDNANAAVAMARKLVLN